MCPKPSYLFSCQIFFANHRVKYFKEEEHVNVPLIRSFVEVHVNIHTVIAKPFIMKFMRHHAKHKYMKHFKISYLRTVLVGVPSQQSMT